MTVAGHSVLPTLRSTRVRAWSRGVIALATVLTVTSGAVVDLARSAGASNLTNARSEANTLLKQINHLDNQVSQLGQRYDEAQIKLHRLDNEITNTKVLVRQLVTRVANANVALQKDVILAYVENGEANGTNPLFTANASTAGAKNVYTQLAEGNISATITSMKNDRLQLIADRGLLRREDENARQVTRDQAKSYHKATVIEANLRHTLAQVKGQIATDIAAAEAAQAAASNSELNAASPADTNIPAPPPSTLGGRAVLAAETFLGVPYVWGGASRSGVDCSGLIMLAYEMVGVDLPHYSGAQYEDTERVPLYDIEPGDLLFYGPGGDTHVAMYVGDGDMIEAEMTGTVVHIVPIRLGYGFVGLGRVR